MRNARIYDIVLTPFERFVLGPWRRDFLASAEGRILEIGAGTGFTLRHYQRPREVYLTDHRPSMLRRAAIRGASSPFPVRTVAADAMRLPFPEGTFDTVVVALALCTVDSPEQAFGEIRRVLQPNGTLRMVEHVRVNRQPVAALQDILTPAWRAMSDGCRLNRPTLQTAVACGFEPITVRTGWGGWLMGAVLRPKA
jgi:ubiquinone/menaquinone biosynthesis C-methylase UbiE